MTGLEFAMACHIGWFGGLAYPAPFLREVEKFHAELDKKSGKYTLVIDDPKSSVPVMAHWVVISCPNDIVYARPLSREIPIS